MASNFPSSHQKRKLGPAPIASFEDLSDENNGEPPIARMPGILEVTTPATGSLKTPNTPRIDISRASSSSQQEDSNSRESTPEKELLAGNGPPEGCKLQLGYKEDANDLRSSTEELDLHDPVHEQDLKRESKRSRKHRKQDQHDGTQSEHGISIKVQSERERKDSNCSEIILLNISGRTSRLSSVGSQGSGVSGGGLSVVSATSSRSPSPHKCLLETSFCGSVSTLDTTFIEPSKPENDDLAKMLLEREEDSTRAMIPESVRVPIVGGNIKPDPLDMPRRRGREERKEAFKREVEITKRVLKRVNIEVPIIKLPKDSSTENDTTTSADVQKPATLDLNERRRRSPSSSSSRPGSAGIGAGLEATPKLQRHQKIRDLEGSRTPSPSSVSRKSSFASIFKGRGDTASIQGQESPSSRRPSLASKLKETAESLRSRSKSRERPSSGDRRSSSVFSSTLSLFRKKERKKSDCEAGIADQFDDGSRVSMLDNIGRVTDYYSYSQQATPSRKKDDVIFISLYGENDEFRNRPEEPEEASLQEITTTVTTTPPPLQLDESSSKGREDSFDTSSPQQTSANIVCTDATIEHHRRTRRSERRREGVRISSSSGESTKMPESLSRDSHISKSDSRDSKIAIEERRELMIVCQSPIEIHEEQIVVRGEHRLSTSSSKDSIGRKPEVMIKPKRKSRGSRPPSAPTEPPPLPPTHQQKSRQQKTNQKSEMNGKVGSRPATLMNNSAITDELVLPTDAGLAKAPSVVSDLDRNNSSESERDSEIDFIKNKAEKGIEELPDERKGLFLEESFEEDLPYVPTTLPMEKSVAIPMLPIKQRLQEGVRTTSIERPRSTTPINPQLLDEYIQHAPESHQRQQRRLQSKMRISLPREESFKLKSPHRPSTTPNTFSEFAERVPVARSMSLTKSPSPPPPLPPRAPTTVLTHQPPRHQMPRQQQLQQLHLQHQSLQQQQQARPANWINFEEIPEKRKPPKRIQTIPRHEDDSKHPQSAPASSGGAAGSVSQFSYVQPEECSCECHDESRRATLQREPIVTSSTGRQHHHHHHHHHHHQHHQHYHHQHHHHPGMSSSPLHSCIVAGTSGGVGVGSPMIEDNNSGGSGGSSSGVCNGAGCPGASGSSNTNGDRSSIISDNSSLEGSLSADYTGTPSDHHHLTVTGSNEGTRPFAMDLDVSSNRSSIISQEETEDERT